MDKQVQIILKLIDEAGPGLASAASGLSSTLKGITAATGSATSEMESAWKSSVSAVTGHIGDLIQKTQLASLLIGGGLVAAVSSAVNMAADFERFGKAAVYLTGSARAADDFAASVRRLSVDTMFNVDQIAKMDSLLIGNTRDTKVSEGALKALTDAVAATGGGYSELEGVTRAWIQTNSKAKASSEELNRQFANANVPILRVLAEHIVKDADSPLRQYINTATGSGGAVGASKQLTAAFEKANDTVKFGGAHLTNLKDKLDEWTKSGHHAKSSVDELQLSIQKQDAALGKANSTIGKYTEAQNKASGASASAKLTVEGVMAQLQKIGDLNIPGSIAASEITKALDEAYGGANQAMLKTFSFQFSALQDNAKLTAMTVLGLDANFKVVKGSLMDILTSALIPVNAWLSKNQDAISKFAGALARSLPVLMAFGTFLLGTIISALLFVIAPVIELGLIFGAMGFAIGIVVQRFGGFQNILSAVKPLITGIKDEFAIFKQNMINLRPVIDGYLKGFGDQFKAFGERVYGALHLDASTISFGNFFGQVWQKLKPQLDNVVIQIRQGFTNAFSNLMGNSSGGNIADFFGKILAVVGPLGELIGRTLSPAINALVRAFASAKPQFDIFLQQIGPLLVNGIMIALGVIAALTIGFLAFFSGIVQAVSIALPFIIQTFTGLAQFVNGIMEIIIGIFTLNWHLIWDGIKSVVLGIWNTIAGAFASIIALVGGFVKGVVDFFIQLYNQLIGHSIIPDLVNGILQWMGGLKDKTLGVIGSLVDGIRGKFMDLVGAAGNWGRSIISNMINGIKSAISGAGKLAGKLMEGLGISANDLLHFAHGGIVPGAVGQPVPIIAHGGEKITPAGSSDVNGGGGGGGVSVNFYGSVTLDSEERVKDLADRIAKIMGRQSELAQLGAAY